METRIKTKPVWSTEQTRLIEESIQSLNKVKRFAWECGINHIHWQIVKAKIGRQISKKGYMLEAAIAYLFGYMNLPIRLSFNKEADLAGADLVFKKTGINHQLLIQLKWNNHTADDSKYAKNGITVVHVDNGMKPADVIKQFQLWQLLGADWYKRITTNHLMMVRFVLSNI